MAILLPNPHPQDAMQVIRNALDLVFQPASSTSPLRQIDPAKAAVAAHLPLYLLDLDLLAKGAGMPPTRRVGSRFMVMVGTAVSAAIDMSVDKADTAKEFLAIMDGPVVDGTKNAIDQAQADPANMGCQVAAWDCPSLKLSIVAVISSNGMARVLYAIAPPSSGLDPSRAYDAATLSALLKPMALLAQQNAVGPGSDTMGD